MAQDIFSQAATDTLDQLLGGSQSGSSGASGLQAGDPVEAIYQVAQERGINPEHLLGLARLETRTGQKTVRGSGDDTRNLFNIKDFGGGGIRARDRLEGSSDAYRRYGSYRESADDLVSLLERKYPGALEAQTPEDFALALKRGGYATDPAYVDKLSRTIRSIRGAADQNPGQTQEWDQSRRYIPMGRTVGDVEQVKPEEGSDGWLMRGWEKSKANAGLTSSLAGDTPEQTAERVAAADRYNQANRGSREKQELGKAWEGGDGILGGLKAVGGEIAKDYREGGGFAGGLVATARNAKALAEGTVEQLPNSVFPMLGMGAGAAAGSLAGPVGTVAGGFAGGAAGNAMIEGGGMLLEAIQKAGINPQDKQAVAQFVKENGDKILGQAAIKGGVISAVDMATLKMGSKLLNGPTDKAVSAALKDMGIDTADKAAVKKALKTPAIKAAVQAKVAADPAVQAANKGWNKAARNTGAALLEPAGEFAGELAGTGLATGEWDTKNAALEAFSSVGQSAGTFAAQKAWQAVKNPSIKAAQQSGGIVSRAGLAATPGAQPPAQPGANPSTPPNPGTPPAGGPTGANGAQPPAQPGAGQQAPGQPSAGQPVTGTNPAAPSQAGLRAKQLGSTANPFVGLFDTDEVYGKWSNLRDGSDRDSMRQLMTDVFKLYANANLSPYDPASLKYELQQGYKWFRSASPQQQDAGVAAIFAAAGQPQQPKATGNQAAAAPAGQGSPAATPTAANTERDPMLDQAIEFVKQSGKPSINAVQRQFKIGYNRAARLLEDMEKAGLVGPLKADGLRDILAAPQKRQPNVTSEDLAQQLRDREDAKDAAEAKQAKREKYTKEREQVLRLLGIDPEQDDGFALLDELRSRLTPQQRRQLLDESIGNLQTMLPSAVTPNQPASAGFSSPEPNETDSQGQAGKTLAEMDDAELQARLQYITDQAKNNGGWNSMLSAARREVQREIARRPKPIPQAQTSPQPTTMGTRVDAQAGPGFTADGVMGMLPAAQVQQESQAVTTVAQDSDQQDPEFTTLKDVYGTTVTVKTEDLNGDSELLRMFTKDGKPVGKRIHRENLDKTGKKLAAQAKEDAGNPIFDIITTRNGGTFAAEGAAERELNKRGMGETHEVVPASTVSPTATGFVIRKKQAPAETTVASTLAGNKINDKWTAFSDQSGTLGIPRAEMPQIKAEHRGAMVNFLKARGIDGQQETIPSAAIKPTQAEFSPAKVKQAMDYQGGNRSIIVSADGYVVDGHHQWLAAREKGESIQAIRLDQNIGDVLAALKDMPSAQPLPEQAQASQAASPQQQGREGNTDKPTTPTQAPTTTPKTKEPDYILFKGPQEGGFPLVIDRELMMRDTIAKDGGQVAQDGMSQGHMDAFRAAWLKEVKASFDANGKFIGEPYQVTVANRGAYLFKSLQEAKRFAETTGMRQGKTRTLTPVAGASAAQPAAAPAADPNAARWDAMSNAEREAAALRAGMPKAAATKWSTRAWKNIDAKAREKLASAIEAEPATDERQAVYELPVDEEVFADALESLPGMLEDQQDDGQSARDKGTFNPDIERISLPRVTSANPRPQGVEFLPQDEAGKIVQSWMDEAARQGQRAGSENAGRTVISLFDASGVMSEPWERAGYNVVRYDIQNGDDINDFNAQSLLDRHGDDNVWAVIAQPPCTDFASSGSQWWAEKDAKGITELSNELVRQTMRTIELFRPPVWWLENPVGRIDKLNNLPKPVLSFDPWHFGDPWTKRTQYWGSFNPRLPTAMVDPVEGSKVHKLSSSAKFERSLTPEGVAYAMFMANNFIGMRPAQRLAHQYPGIEAKLFEQALAAGQTEQDIIDSIDDSFYENDLVTVREILEQAGPSRQQGGFDNATQQQPGSGITADDVAAAEKIAAQMISDRIDGMKAGEVQRIAARYLPTVGIKVPNGKAKIKAAMTNVAELNLLGPAGELGIELADSVKRALVAKMEGRVGVVQPAQTQATPEKRVSGPKWDAAGREARRALLSEAGNYDQPSLDLLSKLPWNQLTDPIRKSLDALNKPAAAPLSLDAQLAQVNDELAAQGMVQNANTRQKRDQLRTAIAERDFPEILKAVDGSIDAAEALHQAFQFSGNEPKAQTIERVLKHRWIAEEYRKRWAERLLAESKPAGREGYDTPVELDAAQLKAILEQTRGEPLVDKPAKLEAWRNGTAKTDPAKLPIELFLTTDGRLDVNDGRHRIALAAERGEKVTAFIDGKDAQRVKDLLAATDGAGVEYVDRMLAEAQQRLDTMRANQAKAGTNAWSWDKKIAEAEQAVAAYQKVRDSMAGGKASETAQDADFQERLERANNRIPEGFEIRAEGNTVSLYRNGERTQYYGLNANDGGMSEAVRQANRLFNLPESSSQAIQDFIDGKSDAVPTLEEVQAGTLDKLEKELADWQVRRELPINQGQIGVIDEEIAKLQAQVDALRGAAGQEGKQPSITANPDLEAIFDQLDGITQRTQAAGQQAAAEHPKAERIQLVQKHILDILEDLEDSGKVTINC